MKSKMAKSASDQMQERFACLADSISLGTLQIQECMRDLSKGSALLRSRNIDYTVYEVLHQVNACCSRKTSSSPTAASLLAF